MNLAAAQLLDRFGKMLINEHHLAVIDRPAQSRIGLERHAARQHSRLDHGLVKIVAQRRTGHQGDFHGMCLGALGQRQRHGLRFPGPRKAAHAYRHAILNETGGIFGADDPVQEGRVADTLFKHALLHDLSSRWHGIWLATSRRLWRAVSSMKLT